MPDITASRQSNIVTWKVISAGTAVVLAVFVVLWLARAASGERALAEQQRMEEMAAESRTLCAKWGMPIGSPKYADCSADIEALRASHARRIAEALEPF
jgi:hypothetical protein